MDARPRIGLVALLALAAGCTKPSGARDGGTGGAGSAGTSGTSGTSGGTGSSAVPYASFCQSLVGGECSYFKRCQIVDPDDALCPTGIAGELSCSDGAIARVNAGQLRFDAVRGQACLNELAHGGCTEPDFQVLHQDCDAIIAPSTQIGGLCSRSSDCAPVDGGAPFCYAQAGPEGCIGTCTLGARLGQPCGAVPCAHGACRLGTDGGGVCTAYVAEGGACDGGGCDPSIDSCVPNGGQAGTCQPSGASNAPCDPQVSGSCLPGLTCVQGSCHAAIAQVGQQCGSGVSCAGSDCSNPNGGFGVCVARAGLGQICGDPVPRCEGPFLCDGGSCQPRAASGEPCAADGDCRRFLSCNQGTCLPDLAQGVPCAAPPDGGASNCEPTCTW